MNDAATILVPYVALLVFVVLAGLGLSLCDWARRLSDWYDDIGG